MNTLSQGSDGNVEVSSTYQKPMGVSPMQSQQPSRMCDSPTFRSKSNDRRSSANLCKASFDKAQDLIRRAKTRRVSGIDDPKKPPVVSQTHDFKSIQKNLTTTHLSASMNRMQPLSHAMRNEVTKFGKDTEERRTANSMTRNVVSNPFRRSENA